MSKPDDDELRALWRSQNAKEPPMSLENVMKQETKFARTIWWRNAREYVAAGPVVGAFTWMAFFLPAFYGLTARAGCLLIVLGTVFVVARVRSHGTALPPPSPSAPTREHVAHYRAELVRQRDMLANVPRWYLGPLVPGMLVLLLGVVLDRHADGMPFTVLAGRLAYPLAEVVGIFGLIAFANLRGAKKLSRQIEALGDE